jgi:hypothetical protein
MTHSFAPVRRFAVAGIAAAAMFAGAGCEDVPLLAPSGSAIALTATANELTVNGSTEIVALVLEGAQGAPTQGGGSSIEPGAGTIVHNGTVVSFTTTLGRIDPAEAKTVDGVVRVRLIADTHTGVATVTAFSGPAIQTLQITIFPAGGE